MLGFQDETWWSRVKQPNVHGWYPSDSQARMVAQTLPKDDPGPKALACYGLLVQDGTHDEQQMLLRFADRGPVSAITIDFLAWCGAQLEAQGKKALLMVWDNASWHTSHMVRDWLTQHNHAVKESGQGVRIISCLLPTKSPWLNPIEPHWMHAKRNVAEPTRLLSPSELSERVCAYFGCSDEEHLVISKMSI